MAKREATLQHASVIVGGVIFQLLGEQYVVELKSIFGGEFVARILLTDRKMHAQYVIEVTGDGKASKLFLELGYRTNRESYQAASMQKVICDIDGILRITDKLRSITKG